uniref:Dolichol-phosphate mannosyltransferase subunit 3 n=1 Tax=Oryza punctata TaxID=4537 RepID=A0A0E0M3A5_ORYPU
MPSEIHLTGVPLPIPLLTGPTCKRRRSDRESLDDRSEAKTTSPAPCTPPSAMHAAGRLLSGSTLGRPPDHQPPPPPSADSAPADRGPFAQAQPTKIISTIDEGILKIACSLPIYFVVALGCYGLFMVGFGLMFFPTCPQEAVLLQQDIVQTKDFLSKKGVDVGSE